MFIEIVDALRCPRAHKDSWLVLSAERMDGRDVMEGVLGCPACRTEYPVVGGIADLRAAAGHPPQHAAAGAPDAGQGMRLAAFLNLTEGEGFAVLVGEWARHAAAVQAVTDVQLLLVNPPVGAVIGAGISGLLVDGHLALATASARGIALDAHSASLLADATRAVQSKGRLVAPVAIDLPAGVTELARDSEVWVGERDAGASGLISLTRGAR